jgi:hypothetical protein
MHPRMLFLLTVCLFMSTAGCGDGRTQRFPVSGQVTIDGVPLEHGFVQVIPANDRPATGKIGSDGRFQLTTYEPNDGCVPGTHKVAIIANETLDPRSQKWHAPKSYMDPTTSELEVTVTEATSPLKLELTWDGAEPFVERFDAE